MEGDEAVNDKIIYHDLKLYKENDLYYLDITFQIESDNCIEEVRIPKAGLPAGVLTYDGSVNIRTNNVGSSYVDIGFGELYMHESSDGHRLTRTVLEHKTKEMTLSEIEKKLGHKVKIIAEENSRK